MTTQNYEQIKTEIADSYIKKFKDELGRFKSLAVLPFEGKLKKIMISDKDLKGKTLKDLDDLGRWRNILWTMSPKLANNIFDFLKEKQLLIVQAETTNKLEDLRNEVVFGSVVVATQDTKTDTKEHAATQEATATSPSYDTNTEDREKTWENLEEGKERNSIQSGVVAGVTWATARKIMEKNVNKFNDMKLKNKLSDIKVESVSAKKEIKMVQGQIDKIIEKSEDAAKNPKISKAMRKNIEKSSKKFWEVADALNDGEVIDARDARGKLGKDMPAELLDAVDPKTSKILSELDNETRTLIAKSKSTDEISEILIKKWIKNIDPKVINIFKEMDDVPNIEAFSKVLRFGKKLSPIMKGLSNFGALDLLFFGFDVWMRSESMNEADFIAKVNEARASVKKDRATFELWMGAASIVLEFGIILSCTAIWTTAWSVVPWIGNAIGLVIGVAVWVLVFTTQELVNQLYYDKLEFYTQNKEEYIRQERTSVKQAILQCAKEQDVDVNPNLTDTALKDKGINTFQDAWEALIFQEEMKKYENGQLPTDTNLSLISQRYYGGSIKSDFVKGLSDEDKVKWDKEWEMMDARIGKRMEYVKTFITKKWGSEGYENFMKNIKSNTGLSYIEKIVGDSDMYMEINQETNEYLPEFSWTVNEYRDALWANIKEKYPKEFELFENMYKNDIYQFEYICTWAEMFVLQEDVYTPEEYAAIKKNKEFIHLFYHYKKVGLSLENTKNVTIDYTDYDYNYLERSLIDFDEINKRSNFNQKDAIDYFSRQTGIESRLTTDFQVSSSTGQNIIYRMAREFHGYGGNNDMFELMSFYNESSDSTKGIYYDNEWMVNNDENVFGWDRRYNSDRYSFVLWWVIGNAIINWFSTIDRDRNLEDIDKKNMTASDVYDKFDDVLMLDSKVDVADKEAVEEFRKEIKKIIEEEIAAKAPAKKKEVEVKIAEFVEKQSEMIGESSQIAEDWSLVYSGKESAWYVEIPYELVIAAKRAKIGDVEKFLFKYENGKIIAISSQQYVDTSLSFDTIDVGYERVTPLRDELTEEELAVIGKVDMVKERLSTLRSVESAREDKIFWWLEDKLDIPVEIEREMTNKVYEWENIKESLLYLNINESKSKLLKEWKSYYDYFNGTYIGMLASAPYNIWNFTRMSEAWARIGKEKYKMDEKGEINIDHLDLVNAEKEFIMEYIKKSYQWETKTVAELLKSDDETEKQRGEWMLDQVMIAIFESKMLGIDETGKYILREAALKIEEYLGPNMPYISVVDKLSEIDKSKIKENKQSIKKVSEMEKETYKTMDKTLATIINTMNNVDRWHWRKEIKFLVDDKKSTEMEIVGTVQSYWVECKVYIDTAKKTYKIEGLEYSFTDVNEFAYTTNLINWVKGYYLKKNPDMKGMFFFGSQLYPNTLFADRNRNPNDVEILSGDQTKSHFQWLKDGNESNRKALLKYLNAL